MKWKEDRGKWVGIIKNKKKTCNDRDTSVLNWGESSKVKVSLKQGL